MFNAIKIAWQKLQKDRKALKETERRRPIQEHINKFKQGSGLYSLVLATREKRVTWDDRNEIASLFNSWATGNCKAGASIDSLLKSIPTYWRNGSIELNGCREHIINLYYNKLEEEGFQWKPNDVSKLLAAMSDKDHRKPIVQAVLNNLMRKEMDSRSTIQ